MPAKCIFQTMMMRDGIAEQKFRVQGFPYKVLISPEGTVLKAYLGESEEFYQYLDSTLLFSLSQK